MRTLFRINMTSLIDNISKKNKEGEAQLVFSMDDEETYGPIFHRLSFAQAAAKDVICGYKVLISVIDSETVNNHLLDRGEVLVEGDLVRARQVAAQIAAKPARVIRAAKASLNGIDPVDVNRSYRFEQGFTFELNLAGEGDAARDAFVVGDEESS